MNPANFTKKSFLRSYSKIQVASSHYGSPTENEAVQRARKTIFKNKKKLHLGEINTVP